MLIMYRTRKIRITTRLTKWIVGSAMGVLVLTLTNLAAGAVLGVSLGLRGGGIPALVFSLACICVAAFTFMMNFEVADQMIRYGAAAKWAWYVAFGLAMAVVWLYLEMLRLMSFRFVARI